MLHEICGEDLPVEIRSRTSSRFPFHMPATDPINTPAATSANDSTESKEPGLLAHLWAFTPKAQRFLFWGGVSVALTCGMSAATHFLDGPKPDPQADVGGASGGHSSGSGIGGWWNPASGSIEATTADPIPASPDATPPSPSPSGSSVIPVDRSAQFSTGSLTVGAPAPIGSSSSREAYAVLGLGTGSSTRLSNASITLSSGSVSSDLHFSLSGDLTLVPTDNLAAGGLSSTFIAVPEPSIGGLMASALAGLALRRHRKPQPAA
ncbi:MAG: PEP-CTERM sorting domain-containing protein [Chthoniobacter sp.]|nr:PEP-CTERM sorting domain-containing protein [Chthoniobacter sp.]